MRAKIYEFHSPDALDLEKFRPDDPEDFEILLQVMVGPSNESFQNSFDIVVCAPKRLAILIQKNGPLIGRHHLIVNLFNYRQIENYLTKLIETQYAPTWEQLAARVGRIGYWEFEDYRP